MTSQAKYIHGYHPKEQQRLIDQAAYWRQNLILPDLPYRSGDSLLEIACGAGAVLAELGRKFPGLKLSGIDFEPAQITYARNYLDQLKLDTTLVVGNALELPWESSSFDHVYIMWFLEHVSDPLAALTEAKRVLRPGGSITINETDYTTLLAEPETQNIRILRSAFCELFNKAGRASTGPQIGDWLHTVGFDRIVNHPLSWQFDSDNKDLKVHAEYILGFIEPSLEDMAQLPGFEYSQIKQGIADFRAASSHPQGRIGLTPWRAQAYKAK